MARLPTAAKSLDRVRARATLARQRLSYRPRTYSYPQDARPSDWVSSMERRDAGPVDNGPHADCGSRRGTLIGAMVLKGAASYTLFTPGAENPWVKLYEN